MAKQLLVEDNDIPVLKEFYILKREKVAQELDSIDRIISQLSSVGKPPTVTQISMPEVNGYPVKGSWIDKIKYVISKYGEATSVTIIEEALKNEPDKKRSSLVPTIGGKLGELFTSGVLTRVANEKSIYVYKIKPLN